MNAHPQTMNHTVESCLLTKLGDSGLSSLRPADNSVSTYIGNALKQQTLLVWLCGIQKLQWKNLLMQWNHHS